MTKGKRVVTILWALLLFGFTVYAALDTFVIAHSYAVVEAQDTEIESTPSIAATVTETGTDALSLDAGNTAVPTAEAKIVSTENSYSDSNVTITIQEMRAYDSTIYVADVVLSSPEYLQTAFANSTFGRNVTARTSSIAENANAVLAINGDYYGARQSGYVIRNGVIYRSKANRNAEDLVIYQDGSFGIINESEISAQALLDNGAWNVLSFGPALLIDGEIAVSSGEEVGRAMASNPRTAIGIVDDLHYLFVVSDGRTNASEGLSLRELAQVLKELGAKTAYNLDGGGSSTMVFQGQVVNNPTSNGKRITERSVSDIVCITC
ncbi:MAG: phosphodiester glycosidase family protein [Clostridia bacterium]|nr:phosphodiester glycosidase family protein [Clostridia bacterium]